MNQFGNITPVVKNLLIINGLFFLATIVMSNNSVNLIAELGIYYFHSPNFEPYQIFTNMFMHGGFEHLFFNMFGLWMFGTTLEMVWGSKRFLTFYFVTGLGAAAIHMLVQGIEIYMVMDTFMPDLSKSYPTEIVNAVSPILYTPTVGASGAIYGLLLGFGMLFPNREMMLLFLPIPIKAKYFVAIFGAIALFSGLANRSGDNVAHFAHLGGMLFGYLMIKYWQRHNHRSYF